MSVHSVVSTSALSMMILWNTVVIATTKHVILMVSQNMESSNNLFVPWSWIDRFIVTIFRTAFSENLQINYLKKEGIYTYTYFNLIYRKACRPALLLLEKFESVERAPSFRAKQRKQRPHHLQITKGGQDTFQHMLENEILLKFWPIWLCSFFSLPWHFARHNRFWQKRI